MDAAYWSCALSETGARESWPSDNPPSDGYERKSDQQVSTTDPDAVAMKARDLGITVGALRRKDVERRLIKLRPREFMT